MSPRRADHVAVDAHQRRGGKELRQRRLDAFRALADRRAAPCRSAGSRRAAPVPRRSDGRQARLAQMHGEPRVAGRAGRDPGAAGAEQRRRVAAAIQEHEHLACGGEVPLDRRERRLRESVARRVQAQVDDADARLAGAARAFRQRELRVTAGRGVGEALERRRRGAEHDRHARALRAHDREVARRIAESVLLLVGGIVLLVHDDEAERRHRR